MACPENPSPHVDALAEIDLTSALDYMNRHGVGRMDMTIETLDAQPRDATRVTTTLAVIEFPAPYSDNEIPSPDGLSGVFITTSSGGLSDD